MRLCVRCRTFHTAKHSQTLIGTLISKYWQPIQLVWKHCNLLKETYRWQLREKLAQYYMTSFMTFWRRQSHKVWRTDEWLPGVKCLTTRVEAVWRNFPGRGGMEMSVLDCGVTCFSPCQTSWTGLERDRSELIMSFGWSVCDFSLLHSKPTFHILNCPHPLIYKVGNMNKASAFHSLTTLSIYKMLAQYSSL